MSRKTTIINALIASVSSVTQATGFRGIRFLNEINNFPAFYVHNGNERRVHISSGVSYAVLSLTVRGYCWTDNLDAVDAFARDIEFAVQAFYRTNRAVIEELRVTSLQTDEGLMSPYGIIDLTVDVTYQARDGDNQPLKIIPYTISIEDSIQLTTEDGYILLVPSIFI